MRKIFFQNKFTKKNQNRFKNRLDNQDLYFSYKTKIRGCF